MPHRTRRELPAAPPIMQAPPALALPAVGNAEQLEGVAANVEEEPLAMLQALEQAEEAGDVEQDAPENGAEQAEAPRYSHLDVTAPLYNIDIAGNFEGEESTAAYEAAREQLVEDGTVEPNDRQIRMQMIRGHVAEAETNRANSKEDLGADEDVMGMMMLPEWFLGKNLTKKDMKKNRKELTELSEQYPEVLIQPGSAVWQERKRKPNSLFKKKTHMHSDADAFFGGEHKHTTQKMFDGMDTNQTKFAYGSDKGEAVPSQRKRDWFANANEREHTEGFRHEATEASTGSKFEAGDRSFALEICGDHGSHGYRALNEMHEDPTFDPVDVHLMTSNGAQLQNTGGIMREGGLGIQNDAGRGQSFAHSATDTDSQSYATMGQGGLHMADVAADQVPEDAEYARPSMEQLASQDLTTNNRDAHLGTFRLPG